jgi:hypothetical protein
MECLLQEIEQKRFDMLFAAKKYGLTSERTIQLSQELDEMLNTYNNALKRISSDFTYMQQNAI